jgi:hypothetical protein
MTYSAVGRVTYVIYTVRRIPRKNHVVHQAECRRCGKPEVGLKCSAILSGRSNRTSRRSWLRIDLWQDGATMKTGERDNRTVPVLFAETVIARLRTLREEHPDAQVTTELVRLDETVALVRAAIVLPNGGSASGFGSAGSGGHDAVEDAETRALNRALTVLGYAPTAPTIPATPVEETPQRAQPLPPAKPAQETTVESSVPVEREAPPVRQPAPERTAARAEPARTATAPTRQTPAAELDDDPPLADYSWTEFWKWARSLGFGDKQMVEELIGQSISNLNPAQVRVLLREKTEAE